MDTVNRIKQDSYEIKTVCPTCDAKLDGSVGVSNNSGQRAPRPGDLSLCVHCGEPARFDQGMKLEKISNAEREKLLSESPDIARATLLIKSRLAVEDPNAHKRYTDQLDTMQADVKAWKAAHHDLDISIQYNYQEKVGVIGTLKEGIDSKFITVNDHAVTMFRELGWLEDGPTMPTIIMVRVVLEHTFGKE